MLPILVACKKEPIVNTPPVKTMSDSIVISITGSGTGTYADNDFFLGVVDSQDTIQLVNTYYTGLAYSTTAYGSFKFDISHSRYLDFNGNATEYSFINKYTSHQSGSTMIHIHTLTIIPLSGDSVRLTITDNSGATWVMNL